jgi:hypothetical protein
MYNTYSVSPSSQECDVIWSQLFSATSGRTIEAPLYNGDIYYYDGVWYLSKFPEEWAKTHIDETGPSGCVNCLDYGCVNRIFIGYCVNCAIYKYHGARGRGFETSGVECADEDVVAYPSAFETYLSGVDVDDIAPLNYESEDDVQDEEYNESDYVNADPYEDTYAGEPVSIFECHYEGGYNDF